jgi:hypothetical protein
VKSLSKIDRTQYRPIGDGTTIIGDLLTPDDLFEDPKGITRKVLHVDDKNIYAAIRETKNNQIIVKSFSKESIVQGYVNSYGAITSDEIDAIFIESKKAEERDFLFSRFANPNKARNGDYFVYTLGGKEVIGKVTDFKYRKAVILKDGRLATISYKDIEATFFTNRDISSDYGLSIYTLNN